MGRGAVTPTFVVQVIPLVRTALRTIASRSLRMAAGLLFVTTLASAEDSFARVIVDEVDLRIGPGVSFRSVARASRGDTFEIVERTNQGYWLRVRLPDGRSLYVLGDAIEPFLPNESTSEGKGAGFFAPPPLAGANAGLSLVAGVLRAKTKAGGYEGFGYMEARPSWVLHKTVSLDAFIGDAMTSDGTQLIYGAGVTVYLFPHWVICPFVGIGGGGYSVFPSSDSFVLQRDDTFLARAGGGFLFALRNRILVRLEATNMTLFKSDSYVNAQTFAGGLGVYF
ncbi:MAG: SH3 domain-containing protein [Polyangiaceae bacterium]|nr:SH3 domain-containing protein [Polyangiaceae bacterium]